MSVNLMETVKAAGVVGAGGAGFPTHVKLQSQKIEAVIANGAECEPLLEVDRLMMLLHAGEVVKGLWAVKEALHAAEGIIAVKRKNADAVQALQAVLRPGIRLHLLEDIYPVGDEQVMIYEATGRVVPPGGLPLDVRVLVSNVTTLYQVHEATENRPFTQRFVTVTGYVRRPVTIRLPIGVRIAEAITLAGGPTIRDYRVVSGGPMMGQIVRDLDAPVTKTTSGLIVLPPDHPVIVEKEMAIEEMLRRARSVCCRCEGCSEVCPRGLLGHGLQPHRIMRAVSHSLADPALVQAYLCSECGLCIYGCNMGLSPRKINQAVKQELRRAGVQNSPDRSRIEPSSMRPYRLIPSQRVKGRFGLMDLAAKAPLFEDEVCISAVRIPLRQHAGVPAEPVVAAGDRVEAGQMIGRIPEGALGAHIHASIAGVVVRVDEMIHIEGADPK